ncbi:MAG: hypothetical protein ACI8YQ_005025 [Polaribacter sp.]|jgi:hypothetical protein
MKKITTILVFVFMTYSLFAQTTWDIKVPNGNKMDPIELIKTNDGGFFLLSLEVDINSFQKLSQSMVKFDGDGQVLWEKKYDFGVTNALNSGGVYPDEAIELNNGDLLTKGRYFDSDTSYCYLLKTNSNGDSLLMKNFGSYCFGGLQYGVVTGYM